MLLKQIKRTIKEEPIKNLLLRTLKVISIKIHQFITGLPCIFTHLVRKKVPRNINNYKMYLYLGDKGIARELFIHKKRELYGTDLFLKGKLVKEGDIVLDIGANIGYFALMESKIVGSSGTVYAVEPSPVNYQRLNENIKLNEFNNIQTFNLALGDKNGKTKMFISNKSNWSRLIERDLPDKVNQILDVEIQTVDHFLKEKPKPSFIRMDVEGYEINIIKGITQTLNLEKLGVFIEFHPSILSKNDVAEIFHVFREKGFEVKYCFINPMLDKNPFIKFAYKMLGEYDFYAGKFYQMNMIETEKWVLNTKLMKCPHIYFCKGR